VDEKQSRLDNMTKEYKEKKEECDKLTERIESIGEKFKLEHESYATIKEKTRKAMIGVLLEMYDKKR
jgi:hypothetical protein